MKITPQEFKYFMCKDIERIQSSPKITNGDYVLLKMFQEKIFPHKKDKQKMYSEIEKLIQ
jgi:hypothetical protein